MSDDRARRPRAEKTPTQRTVVGADQGVALTASALLVLAAYELLQLGAGGRVPVVPGLSIAAIEGVVRHDEARIAC